jgi:hypothetical protein
MTSQQPAGRQGANSCRGFLQDKKTDTASSSLSFTDEGEVFLYPHL